MKYPNPHILSFEFARGLKDAGAPNESALDLYWFKMPHHGQPLLVDTRREKLIQEAWGYATCAAFTASEIAAWLPACLVEPDEETYRMTIDRACADGDAGWECRYVGGNESCLHRAHAASLPDVLAEMLLWLFETGRATPTEWTESVERAPG